MPSYAVSSTRLGSTSTMRTSSGVARVRMLTSRELMQTDLPAPVAPAMRMCGVLARLATTKPPSMSLPSATSIGWWSSVAVLLRRMSPRLTFSRSVLGISMPIALLPGIDVDDPDVRALHGVGDVALQRLDPLDLDGRAELDLVPGDGGAAGEAGDGGVDLEVEQHLAERPDDLVVGGAALLGRRAGGEQLRRGQHVVALEHELLGLGRRGRVRRRDERVRLVLGLGLGRVLEHDRADVDRLVLHRQRALAGARARALQRRERRGSLRLVVHRGRVPQQEAVAQVGERVRQVRDRRRGDDQQPEQREQQEHRHAPPSS